jgi:5'-3' exonuclease
MGIPSYFSWIIKNHPDIIKKFSPNCMMVNNLYIDCNSIIYDVIHKIDFIKNPETSFHDIIKLVCSKIDEYVNDIKPIDNVYIAFDGVAPVAKLTQQRERRYKSFFQNTLTRSILKDSKPDPWNTSAITPGTNFMKSLNEFIYSNYTDPTKFNVKNIIISCSDECGEGEHKLFEYIRNYPEEHINKNTVIYGLDADLIMLSINHLPITSNIYLFRETPHFIKSLNTDLEPNELYVLDIPTLSKIISNDLSNGSNIGNCIYDYIFLCFFLGNDFMPHFPSVNIRTGGIEKLLNAYKATIGGTNQFLTDGKTIYWKNVLKVIHFLAKNEETNLKQETKKRDRKEKQSMPSNTDEDRLKQVESIPLYDRSLEKYINPYKPGWQERYYKSLFQININETNKKQICTNYLEGLEWTMKYYTVGCPDWRWCYNYKYPPLLCDLVQFIPNMEKDFLLNININPVSDIVQLSYVLPKQSLHMLPIEVQNKLLKTHSHWYKTDCDFVWAYCRYFWESHVNLPNIDIIELEELVN